MEMKKMNLEDFKKSTVETLKEEMQKEIKGGEDIIVEDDLVSF